MKKAALFFAAAITFAMSALALNVYAANGGQTDTEGIITIGASGIGPAAETSGAVPTSAQSEKSVIGRVKADILNLRDGGSQEHSIIGQLENGKQVVVLAYIGEWAAVYDSSTGQVGAVCAQYLETAPTVSENTETVAGGQNADGQNAAGNASMAAGAALTEQDDEFVWGKNSDEKELKKLVNRAREEAGLSDLKTDAKLTEMAKCKAEDMVQNNYFDHNSPAFGTPFEMMKSFGIEFVAAGENIAGNESVQNAFEAWISSEEHSKNILNSEYDYMGIGIAESEAYGKIIVLEMIKK